MADDILSQEEVDALLRGVTGEADEPKEEKEVGGIRPYDIGRQERIVRGRMPTLELINERFARLLRIGLYNFMRKNAEISVNPIKVVKFSDYLRGLSVPTNLNLVQIHPLNGTALVIIEPGLVFQVVDQLFGGSGQIHTRIEGREFTPTEQRVIRRMLDVIFEELQKSWTPVYKINFEYVRSEMNTQFANIATPSEVVVTMSWTVDLGAASGDIHMCVPYAMLEPIRDVIYSSVQADRMESDARWLKTLSAQIENAEVELVAKLAETTMTLRDVVSLEVGDVIAIDIPDFITAEVDGVEVFDCKFGLSRGRYGLKVNRVVSAPSLDGGKKHG